jgi:hypothetical protein
MRQSAEALFIVHVASGPVLDPGGACIGTFTSVWRLEAGGDWKIIFDKGSSDCPQ